MSALMGSTLNGKKINDGDGLAAYFLEEARVSLVGGNDFGAPHHVRIS